MRPLPPLRLLEERGKGLTRIELSDVAEINLNALLLIGRSCRGLKHLSVKCCHFQVFIDTSVQSSALYIFWLFCAFPDSPWRRGVRRRHMCGKQRLVFAPLLPRSDGPKRNAPRHLEGRRSSRVQRPSLCAQLDSRLGRGHRSVGLTVERSRKVILVSP